MQQSPIPCLPPTWQGFTVKAVPTKPIEGQKTGTSGLRKKTKVFMSEHYLANWCGPSFAAAGGVDAAAASNACLPAQQQGASTQLAAAKPRF